MVHIAAGIPLLTVTDGTEILGVIEKCKADTFLLTSNRSITIFKSQDPKPLQSWVNKPSSRFTCPAVYIQETDEFVAVVNDKQIYKWSSENATPFKQKPKTLKSAVSRILIQEGGNPLLLMSNGSVRLLDDAVGGSRAIEKGCLDEGEEIRDAWIWRKGADENITSYIICLVQNSLTKKKSILLLPVQPVEKQHDKSGDDVMRLQLDDPINEACPLESATLFTDETTAVLHTLWDGGRLCSTSITESDLRRYKDSPTLSCHHRCTINGSTGKVRMAAIDETHVAVAGMQSKTTKDKLEASLCIWETAFGTLQMHHALSVEDSDGDGTPLFLGEVNGHLLLATRSTVMLHRYECSDGTLAAALGRLAGPGPGLHQDLPILGLDWTSSLPEQSPVKKPKGRKSTASTKTQTKSKDSDGQASLLLNSILDESNTQTSKAFSGSVEKYMKACRGDQPDSTTLMLILKNVVKRVETNPKFWCPETLHDVITTKAVAASSCPEFIAMLARKQEVSLLLDCLQCMRDVPELILMQCLQVFLSIDEDKLPSSRQTTETEDSDVDDVMSPTRRTYVDEVLCKPFTDTFLLDAVKHLPFKEVTSLLRYLHFLLTTSFPGGDDSSSLVSMDNVVDWIGAMLDAHFAQLVLLPEARPLLTHLQNAVKDQVQFSAELNVVRNLLHHTHGARSHIKATPSNAAKSYSIEVLKM